MKQQIKNILRNTYSLFNTLYYAITEGLFISPFKLSKRKMPMDLTILGNGPSLKKDIDLALERDNQDFAALNYFALTDLFLGVKPRWYFFMDSTFFSDSKKNRRIDDVIRMYEIFNTLVNWEMTIVIPSHSLNAFKRFSKLSNPHINVLGINAIGAKGTSSFLHWLYKRNWSLPTPQNVTILAIYAGINLGYKNIYLFGVDHSFIQGICVDEENRLCLKWEHFYDNHIEVKPVVDSSGGSPSIAEELLTVAITFHSHEDLRSYSDKVGCRIINCTRGSFIDSYIRYSQLDN